MRSDGPHHNPPLRGGPRACACTGRKDLLMMRSSALYSLFTFPPHSHIYNIPLEAPPAPRGAPFGGRYLSGEPSRHLPTRVARTPFGRAAARRASKAVLESVSARPRRDDVVLCCSWCLASAGWPRALGKLQQARLPALESLTNLPACALLKTFFRCAGQVAPFGAGECLRGGGAPKEVVGT